MRDMEIFVLVLLMVFGADRVDTLTCIGENGDPVSMFILYKLPRLKNSGVDFVEQGLGYSYIDSEMLQNGATAFKLSSNSIASSESAAGRTFNQVYSTKGDNSIAHVFYNDEDENGHSFLSNGHTKGGIGFDEQSGFWVLHSVPRAYPPPSSYHYPDSGEYYGQMFICITFNSTVFNDIGTQLRYNNPHIHDSRLPPQMASEYPSIEKLIDGDMITDEPYHSTLSLQSIDEVKFISFAKSTNFHDDLYSSLVAPALESDLFTETWQHGNRININSTCDKKYTVEDIKSINVQCEGVSHVFSFSDFHDHSKFAVGKNNSYICVGDINRQITQYKRGGGTVCVKNKLLHDVFMRLISDYYSCDEQLSTSRQDL